MPKTNAPPPAPFALGLITLGALALLAAPALAAGIVAAEFLRRRALRWTWALAPALVAGALAALAAPAALERTASALEPVLHADPPTAALAQALLPLWILLAPVTMLAWMLHRDRRDRLRGGQAEQRVRGALGPLDHHRIRSERRQALTDGPLSATGILLGHDEQGRPVRVPELVAHATIVGGSNSGKTTTAQVLLAAHARGGGGFVVLDGKGGRDLPRAAVELGKQLGKPVRLWSIRPYGDPELDAHRKPWNAVGDADPTEVKDRIAASEEQTEPYYAAVAARGLLAAARLIHETSGTQRLDALAASLEEPGTLAKALKSTDAIEHAWLTSLNKHEDSALRGMATRLRTMTNTDGAEQLLPSPTGDEIVLYDAITRGELVVFTLPQGLYPDLVPHVTRYALATLNAVCTRIEATGTKANALVFVDELSALGDGDALCAGFERGRSAGVRYVVATQSLSNLATAGGDKLLHAAIDNAELLVVHRQAVPDAAEFLASIGGTEEAWEHTHKVSDAAGYHLGFDETGERNRRLTDRFRAHPNVIKSLATGQAIIVSQRPRFAVRNVRVKPSRGAAN